MSEKAAQVLVAMLVWNEDGTRFVMGKRRKEPHQGLWSIPCGKVEEGGEMLSQAMVREALEESGLKVEILERPWQVFDRIHDDGRLLVFVVAEVRGEGEELKDDSDLEGTTWFDPNALPPLDEISPVTATLIGWHPAFPRPLRRTTPRHAPGADWVWVPERFAWVQRMGLVLLPGSDVEQLVQAVQPSIDARPVYAGMTLPAIVEAEFRRLRNVETATTAALRGAWTEVKGEAVRIPLPLVGDIEKALHPLVLGFVADPRDRETGAPLTMSKVFVLEEPATIGDFKRAVEGIGKGGEPVAIPKLRPLDEPRRLQLATGDWDAGAKSDPIADLREGLASPRRRDFLPKGELPAGPLGTCPRCHGGFWPELRPSEGAEPEWIGSRCLSCFELFAHATPMTMADLQVVMRGFSLQRAGLEMPASTFESEACSRLLRILRGEQEVERPDDLGRQPALSEIARHVAFRATIRRGPGSDLDAAKLLQAAELIAEVVAAHLRSPAAEAAADLASRVPPYGPHTLAFEQPLTDEESALLDDFIAKVEKEKAAKRPEAHTTPRCMKCLRQVDEIEVKNNFAHTSPWWVFSRTVTVRCHGQMQQVNLEPEKPLPMEWFVPSEPPTYERARVTVEQQQRDGELVASMTTPSGAEVQAAVPARVVRVTHSPSSDDPPAWYAKSDAVGDPALRDVVVLSSAEGDAMLVQLPAEVDRAAFAKMALRMGDTVIAWVDAGRLSQAEALTSLAVYVEEATKPDDVKELHETTCDMLGYDPDAIPSWFAENEEEPPSCTCGILETVAHLRALAGGPQLCVAAIVLNERSEALLVRSAKRGRWETPGGRRKLGESAEDAIARELLEETGVRIRLHKAPTHLRGQAKPGAEYPSEIDLFVVAGEGVPVPGAGILDARWFPRADIAEMEAHGQLADLDTTPALIAWAKG